MPDSPLTVAALTLPMGATRIVRIPKSMPVLGFRDDDKQTLDLERKLKDNLIGRQNWLAVNCGDIISELPDNWLTTFAKHAGTGAGVMMLAAGGFLGRGVYNALMSEITSNRMAQGDLRMPEVILRDLAFLERQGKTLAGKRFIATLDPDAIGMMSGRDAKTGVLRTELLLTQVTECKMNIKLLETQLAKLEKTNAERSRKADAERLRAVDQDRADAQARQSRVRNWADEELNVGGVLIYRPMYELAATRLRTGGHVLLTGAPGTAKTTLARAFAAELNRKLFHQEVSGFTDVTQLEGERFIEERNGSPVTGYRPTQFLQALRYVCDTPDAKALVVIDEIVRVTDASILNPLLFLMSHGEYHCTVDGRIYNVPQGSLSIVATANIEPGFSFSGNNRRGLDAALLDRMRLVRLPNPDNNQLERVLCAKGFVQNAIHPHLNPENIMHVWRIANDPKKPYKLMTVRVLLDIAEAWRDLGEFMSLGTVAASLLLARYPGDADTQGFVAALEAVKL